MVANAAGIEYPITSPIFAAIPRELTLMPNWVTWKWHPKAEDSDDLTKVPFTPGTDKKARADDPSTWSGFENVHGYAESGYDGIGFELGSKGPYFVIDADGCLDPGTGSVEPWFSEWVDEATAIGAYIQRSNSGTGLHIIVNANRPWSEEKYKTCVLKQPSGAHVDLFAGKQFLIMTGRQYVAFAGTIPDGQPFVDKLWKCSAPASIRIDNVVHLQTRNVIDLDDEELIEAARKMGNGENFRRLYDDNDWQSLGRKSQSDGDMALLVMLAWLTWNDRGRIARLFESSAMITAPTTAARWKRRSEQEIDHAIAFNGNQGYEPNANTTASLPLAGKSVSEHTKQADAIVWDEICPLPPSAIVPRLLPDLLPEPIKPWVIDAAEQARILPEMVAVSALVAISSLISVGIRPQEFTPYTVYPNLWGAVIAPPGWMKSYAIDEGFRHLRHLAVEAHKTFEEAKIAAAVELADIEDSITDIRRRMRLAKKNGESTEDLKCELDKKLREQMNAQLTERRYIVHDATIEKMHEILKDQPRGLAVQRDELAGLLGSFTKSGRENDRQFYLEGWNGTSSFSTDRIGRGSLYLDRFAVSVIGSIQPGRIRPMIEDATSGTSGDDGLLQRFQLIVWPDSLDEWIKPTSFPDSEHKARAFRVYEAIDRLSPRDIRADTTDGDIPFLRFSPGAQRIADEWWGRLENLQRSDTLNAMPAYASHLSKYRSLMPSLALIFHLINVVDGKSVPGPVTEAPTRMAIEWCKFLDHHARKVYDVEIDRGLAAARLLAAKIEMGAIVDGHPVREIYRNQWAGLRSSETVLSGLTVLAELNWVRTASSPTTTNPQQVVLINPAILERAA